MPKTPKPEDLPFSVFPLTVKSAGSSQFLHLETVTSTCKSHPRNASMTVLDYFNPLKYVQTQVQ